MTDTVETGANGSDPTTTATTATTAHPSETVVGPGPIDVGPIEIVPLDRGVAVLLPPDEPGGEPRPVAVFRLSALEFGQPAEWHAVSHIDPATGAPVIARGLVGSVDDDGETIPTVASPLHKQRFDLRTGRCLDDPELTLPVFGITVVDGRLLIDG